MPGGWAGTYTIELVTSTPHAAKTGHRAIMDLDVLSDVTVLAPTPTENGTFSVWWVNTSRNTLTIDGNGNTIQSLSGPAVSSFDTTLHDGVIGFVWNGSSWLVSDFNPFDVPVGLKAAVIWEPRATNGLCTIVDSQHVATVERTAEGTWLITTDGTDITGRIIMPTLNTIGHALNMHPTFTIQDKTATTVELLTGLRNPGGPFNSDDLDQAASNTISIVIASIP